MIILAFMWFFMAFDLTAVLYVLYFKFKEKIDYIAIDHHIFDVTLFRGSYVKFSDKKKSQGKYLNTGNGKYLENGKFNWN